MGSSRRRVNDWSRAMLWIAGASAVATFWSHIPNVAVVVYTLSIPQHDIGNSSGLYTIMYVPKTRILNLKTVIAQELSITKAGSVVGRSFQELSFG